MPSVEQMRRIRNYESFYKRGGSSKVSLKYEQNGSHDLCNVLELKTEDNQTRDVLGIIYPQKLLADQTDE